MTGTKEVSTTRKTDTIEHVGLTLAEARKRRDKDEIQSLVHAVAASKMAQDRVTGSVMWDAALTLFNASEVSEMIGTDGAPYGNQQQVAEGMGYTKAYGSRLARLGRAAIRHKVRKGSQDWTFLCSKASDKRFAEVLGKDPATDARFREVLAEVREAEEAKALGTDTRAARPNGAKTEPTGDQSEAEKAKAGEVTRTLETFGDFQDLARGIKSWLSSQDDVTAKKVRASLVRIADEDGRKRETLARKAKAEADKSAEVKAEPVVEGEVVAVSDESVTA